MRNDIKVPVKSKQNKPLHIDGNDQLRFEQFVTYIGSCSAILMDERLKRNNQFDYNG